MSEAGEERPAGQAGRRRPGGTGGSRRARPGRSRSQRATWSSDCPSAATARAGCAGRGGEGSRSERCSVLAEARAKERICTKTSVTTRSSDLGRGGTRSSSYGRRGRSSRGSGSRSRRPTRSDWASISSRFPQRAVGAIAQGALDARPEKRFQDADPPVADLVAEAFDHDGAVGGRRRWRRPGKRNGRRREQVAGRRRWSDGHRAPGPLKRGCVAEGIESHKGPTSPNRWPSCVGPPLPFQNGTAPGSEHTVPG